MHFTKKVINWYSVNKRSLPWRTSINPYTIWLSEIILQQTQIKQGLPYFEAFIANFPTVFDLANASENKVLKLWQGLGYYSRARNLHQSAKYIANDLKGKFPNSYHDLLELKGVGDYTASAIASICFNEKCAVVDGNVYRVLSRYFGIKTAINSAKGKKEFKQLAQELLPKTKIGDYNQAIMEFGAIQCKPAKPNCDSCPLKDSCIAVNKNLITKLPIKDKKLKAVKKYFNFLVFISKNNTTLLEQRIDKGIWQKLYQFPLIESQNSITYQNLNLQLKKMLFLKNNNYSLYLYNQQEIIHKLSHQHLYCKFWIILVDVLPKKAIDIKDLNSFPVPVIIEKFLTSFNFKSLKID
jgi:A/G-specific adenine glycosylase